VKSVGRKYFAKKNKKSIIIWRLAQTMETKTKQIKGDILNASFEAKACHIGSSLSCVGILTDLFYTQKIKPEQFIFSKASGVATYYAILADLGYFPKDKFAEYLKNYPLASKHVPGITHSVGSVGMGLSVAVGLALSDRTKDIYCLISDGQLNEGVTYEAALFARQHKLTNLHVICDNNGIQAMGKTDDILNLDTALEFYQKTFPNFRNVITIKGQGIDFFENKTESHYMNLDEDKLKRALEQI